jgi:isocitrate dehydrogenase
MQTVRGHFDGTRIELLENAPVEGDAHVLVTFLEGGLEVAAARSYRLQPAKDALRPPHVYSEELRKQMASQYRRFTVGSIMTRKIIEVKPTTSVATALHIMRSQGITSVLVSPDSSGEWGIMTMRDMLQQIVIADRDTNKVMVADVASRPLICVTTETSLRDCSQLMLESNVRRLVVCENQQPVGIISDTDIFQIVEERGWGALESAPEQV